MNKPKTIRLRPISLKYVSTSVGNRKYEIWGDNPITNEEGSLVPYEDAITILVNIPNLVTTCSTKVDGKYVNCISDEIQNEINRRIQEKRMGINTEISIADNGNSMNSVLESVLKSQATTIETQTKQMNELQAQIAEMQKLIAEIAKKK